MNESARMLCETPENFCQHTIPVETWRALDEWRNDDGRDDRDLFIVRSDCAAGREVLQRYGNYCVIRDRSHYGE